MAQAPEKLPATAAVVIIGGGIAGLASAWQLAERGIRDIVLLEADAQLGSHSSARNAAIFLPLEDSLPAVWLAQRSRDLLDARLGTSWLSAQGVVLCAERDSALDELRLAARRFGVFHERWQPKDMQKRLPHLAGGAAQHGLALPLGGVIDVHRIMSALARWAKERGARLFTDVKVTGFDVDARDAISGVLTEQGQTLRTSRVVVAAGAWASQLGTLAGVEAPFTPLRRHLTLLRGETMPTWKTPTVWRIDDACYFRPEAGGILASPCDESPWQPCDPESDPELLGALHDKLAQLAPALMGGGVVRTWACLRTMAPDRELVVGEDPRLAGLYWVAGLGGRGMTCGVAAAELLARQMVGLPHPLMRILSPARLEVG